MNRLLSLAGLLALLTAANAYADGPWYDPYQQERMAPVLPSPGYRPAYVPAPVYTPPVYIPSPPPHATHCTASTVLGTTYINCY